jgi:hypothetical protein
MKGFALSLYCVLYGFLLQRYKNLSTLNSQLSTFFLPFLYRKYKNAAFRILHPTLSPFAFPFSAFSIPLLSNFHSQAANEETQLANKGMQPAHLHTQPAHQEQSTAKRKSKQAKKQLSKGGKMKKCRLN